MLLVHDWAAWSMWTGTETGYCRTITWELGYLGSINPPCDVDCFCGCDEWRIKGLEVDIRFQRYACMRGTSVGVIPAGRIPIMVIGLFDCGGGPVRCSDWLSVRSVVVVCPGGVRIVYMRSALTGSSSLMPFQ